MSKKTPLRVYVVLDAATKLVVWCDPSRSDCMRKKNEYESAGCGTAHIVEYISAPQAGKRKR